MEYEIGSNDQKVVLSLADFPAGKKVISTGWVYHVNRKENGLVEKYKACFVAMGFSQKAGIDFGENYAPVIKYTTLRLVLALVDPRQLKMVQMVKSFFQQR